MAVNRGKQFEEVVSNCFLKVPDVSIDRLHDQMNGYKGSSNICDFIVFKKPNQYYIECKSVHGNTLSIYGKDLKHQYGNITNNQWEGLLNKSKIKGVYAGVLCWWIDKNVTKYLPIETLSRMRYEGYKSVRYDTNGFSPRPHFHYPIYELQGKKKRVFFEYNMNQFFKEVR